MFLDQRRVVFISLLPLNLAPCYVLSPHSLPPPPIKNFGETQAVGQSLFPSAPPTARVLLSSLSSGVKSCLDPSWKAKQGKLQCVSSNPVRSTEQAEEEERGERFRHSIPWTAALGQTLGLTGLPRSALGSCREGGWAGL